MNRFVLDCSVTMAWCFENECDARTEAVLDDMATCTACVPGMGVLEVANALLVGERRGRLAEADSDAFIARLQAMNIELEPMITLRATNTMLSLGRRHDLSAYDCAYLDMAMRLGLPLATLDGKLRQAAAAVGVALVF